MAADIARPGPPGFPLWSGPSTSARAPAGALQLLTSARLFEDHVLAHDGVVLLDLEPVGGVLLVLFYRIHVRTRRTFELDGDAMPFSCHADILQTRGRGSVHVVRSRVNRGNDEQLAISY